MRVSQVTSRTWTLEEMDKVQDAARRIYFGASIYGEVRRVYSALFPRRTWEAVRSQINRERRRVWP